MAKSDFDIIHQKRNIESKIVASLERISQAFRVLLWQESKEYSLSPIQIQVLIFLLHHNSKKRKISYLADEFNMTKATISDTVKALEEKRLIRKEYESTDNRSYIIHLTKTGREIAGETSLFAEQLRIPIDKLHSADKENLLLSLLGIIHHLNKAGVITIQRMCYTCQFYKAAKNEHGHFCELLNTQLADTELRIDCAEHQLKAIV